MPACPPVNETAEHPRDCNAIANNEADTISPVATN